MRVINWADLDVGARTALVAREATARAMFDPALGEQIKSLVDDVAARGDQAVTDATKRFDGVTLDPGSLLLGPAEIAAGADQISPEVKEAIAVAIRSSRAFNEAAVPEREWRKAMSEGYEVGEKITPITSVGLFVPAGKGSFPSVLIQIGTPAAVAGVAQQLVIVPPDPATGLPDPAVLEVARQLDITQVLCANGPAGVAAAVWTYGERTLTSLTALASQIASAVWGALKSAFVDTLTLTNALAVSSGGTGARRQVRCHLII